METNDLKLPKTVFSVTYGNTVNFQRPDKSFYQSIGTGLLSFSTITHSRQHSYYFLSSLSICRLNTLKRSVPLVTIYSLCACSGIHILNVVTTVSILGSLPLHEKNSMSSHHLLSTNCLPNSSCFSIVCESNPSWLMVSESAIDFATISTFNVLLYRT